MQGNFRVALPVAALLLAVGACASVPEVAGNTFNSQGPDATRVTVSYDLSYVSTMDYSVPGAYSATAWLFANRQTPQPERSEEHPSELQSLMRSASAVFSLTQTTIVKT